jgi:hypothetical protein
MAVMSVLIPGRVGVFEGFYRMTARRAKGVAEPVIRPS